MREDIISQKIRRELDSLPIDTEPRVMYLLVEIRKVLEHEDDKRNFLYFYSNWVVHPKLDKKWAVEVLKEMSDEFDDDNGLMSRIVDFRKIRQELKTFLKRNALPIAIVEDEKYWIPFRDRLLDILVDTPIQESEENKILNAFVFQHSSSGIKYAYLLVGKEGSGKVFIN